MIPRNYTRSSCAEKHDKLGWVAGFSFTYGNTLYGVRTNQESMVEVLRQALPIEIENFTDDQDVASLFSVKVGGQKEKRGQRDFHLVYQDWNRVARTHDLEEALQTFKMLALDGVHGENPKIQIIYPAALVELDGKNTVLMGDGYLEVADRLAQSHRLQSREFVRFDVEGLVAPCPLTSESQNHQSLRELKPVDSVLRLSETENEKVLSPGEAVVRTLSLARGTDNPQSMMSLLGHLFKQAPIKEVPRALLGNGELLQTLARLTA